MKSFILAFFLTLIFLPPLYSQTATNAPADAKAADAPTSGQAPDDVMKKLSDLVHAGKYEEARQLTAGLLLAYPEDRRLIKAKALIDKLLAPPTGLTSAAPDNTKPSQPLANTSTEPLTGMERVEYNGLIVLARQAEQTTDLPEQTKLLQQFMDQSSSFLQKHPDEMLLWQVRAASAVSLSEPIAGYEAGEKLLAAGAADSDDPNLQGLLGQLKNKGWLDKEWAEKAKQQAELTKNYGWMLGTWSETFTSTWKEKLVNRRHGAKYDTGSAKYEYGLEFHLSKSTAFIEAYEVWWRAVDSAYGKNAVESAEPRYRGTLVDSGEMHWEGVDVTNVSGQPRSEQWEQSTSCEIDQHKRTMTLVFLSWNDQTDKSASQPQIHLFTKSDSSTH
jgi:hypothetical protein